MSGEPKDRRKRDEVRVARRITWLAIGVVAIGYAFLVPASPQVEMIDHHLYRLTTDDMRQGVGYYRAMETAFDEIYGVERAGLTENVRAFRMPTTFLVFSSLPNDEAVWYLFVAVAAAGGIAATYLTSRPLLGVLVTVYLLVLGVFNDGSDWVAQFMATELWAVTPLIAAIAFSLHRRWWWAAGFALLAMLVRETSALVLISGALLAVRGRVPRVPWLGGFTVGAVAYLAHMRGAQPFIDPDVGYSIAAEGSEWTVVLEMIGFGLPLWWLVGPVLWLLAAWHVRKTFQLWPLVGAPLLLPIGGLVMDRKYWGILVVPITLIWGLDRILDVVGLKARTVPADG